MPHPAPSLKDRVKKGVWPSWRYGPNGESAVFNSEEEVPLGWLKKPVQPGQVYVPSRPRILSRPQLTEELTAKGFIVLPTWSTAYMRELNDK